MKVIFIIITFSSFLYSQPKQESSNIFYGLCPFECCQFGQWIIKDSINVYPNEADSNTTSFILTEDDTVFAETGNLHFLKIGKVLVLREIYNFQPNDTLNAYNCMEGEYLVSHKDKKYYVDIFWPMFFYDYEDTEENYLHAISQNEYYGKMIQRPESVWWVKINSAKGDGWIKLKNENLYCFSIKERIRGIDGCE